MTVTGGWDGDAPFLQGFEAGRGRSPAVGTSQGRMRAGRGERRASVGDWVRAQFQILPSE